MSKVKYIVLHILYGLPACLRKRLYNTYDLYKYPELREQKKSFGDLNKDIVFYVIRPYTNSNEGLMSLLLNVCRHIVYAQNRSYIPIVDFKNYKTQYSDDRNVNIWEDYFKQLSPFSLEEVYASKNVILCGLTPTRDELFEPYNRFDNNSVFLAREIVGKYIVLNDNVKEFIDRERVAVNPQNCLGVYLRGTDYLSIKPVGHYIQPTVEQAIPVIDNYLEKNPEHNIFLVTEDESIYKKMKQKYLNKIIITSFDSFIKDYEDEGYLFQSEKLNQISNSKYERGLYYLIKEILLSECQHIIGGNTCGSWAAVAFSKNDTSYQTFDLGKY